MLDNPAEKTGTEIAAVGIVFEASVGDGRVLKMQSAIASDCTPDQLNRLLDTIRAGIERQAAKGDIEKWEIEVEKHGRMIARYEQQMAEADRRNDEAVAAIDEEIKALNAAAYDIAQNAAQAHARSDKRGEFALEGQAKQKVRAKESDIAKKQEERARMLGEKLVAHGQLDTNLRAARDEVAFLSGKIEAARAKL